MKRLLALWLLGIPVCLSAVDIRMHGSNTVGADLAPALLRAWLRSEGFQIEADHALAPLERHLAAMSAGLGLSFDIHAKGSSTGFRALAEGRADIGMSSRPARVEELRALGLDPVKDEYVIALDGIAVIVHPDNPLAALDISQIRDIFSGRIRRWSQLGWSGGAIRVYARDDSSGTFDTFMALVLDDAELSSGALRYESTADLSDDVTGDSAAIGFVALPYVRRAKALAVSDGGQVAIAPDRFSVATEDYPLALRLYFYVPPQRRSRHIDAFLGFAQSRSGQALATRSGFVAQDLFLADIELSPQAPEDYRRFVAGARRLSLNIRFRPGAAYLDSKAIRDLDRIEAYLRRPENAGLQVMLMGFSDATESTPYFAMNLSTRRVDYVADHFIARGINPVRLRGFGQAIPVASNTTESGRLRNRRVEVWLKRSASTTSSPGSAGAMVRASQ